MISVLECSFLSQHPLQFLSLCHADRSWLYCLLTTLEYVINQLNSVCIIFSGRKFVSILMRFWYLTSARLPDSDMEGTRFFQVAIGGEGEAETKRLLTANYEYVYIFSSGL